MMLKCIPFNEVGLLKTGLVASFVNMFDVANIVSNIAYVGLRFKLALSN